MVIGGGIIALRKVRGLIQAGASVRLISPRAHSGLKGLSSRGRIEWRRRTYRSGDLKGAVLVFGATGDSTVNARICREARRLRLPVNIVDAPALCSFTVPARISRGDLLVTLSTGGASPALAKKLRQQVERLFGPEYTPLTRLLSRIRNKKRGGLLDRGRVRRLTELVKGL